MESKTQIKKIKKLSSYQKKFLLYAFFFNDNFAGWKEIATTLIEKGECIVAGKQCIWIGGIGNFIKTEDAKNTIDCTLYKFDLQSFLGSNWCKDTKNSYTSILENKKLDLKNEYQKVEQEYEEIKNL